MKRASKVVVIMSDTQRKDMVGCYGNPDIQTPCLDRLAGQGLRFDRAYACQPVCGPARSGLFTGTWPHSNGSWANHMPLGKNVRSIGQRLSAQGIHAAYIGKWHLDASDYFGTGLCPEGWDPKCWYDMRNYLDELSEEDRMRSRRIATNNDPSLTEEFTFGHRCANRAIDFLETHRGEDFFLVVSYDEPHDPALCPKPFSDMYRGYRPPEKNNFHDSLEDKPEHHRLWAKRAAQLDEASIHAMIENYYGGNSFVDYEIGRVIEAVDRHAPDALVIYTSDHGDMLFSHRLMFKGAAMYDEVTNVPFIVRWPGHAPQGAVCAHPVSHIDVTPTILDAMGLTIPKTLEGKSMLETLRDPTVKPNEAIFCEFHRFEIDLDGRGGFQPIRCGFDGRFKLVINLMVTDELYDLEQDPGEMANLIDSDQHAEVRNRLHDRILEWMNDTRDPFRGHYWERRPWRTDAREASFEYTGMDRKRHTEEDEPCLLDYGTGLRFASNVRPTGATQKKGDKPTPLEF